VISEEDLMCGRYRRRSDKQRIAKAFHVNGPSIKSLVLAPNDDIRPHNLSTHQMGEFSVDFLVAKQHTRPIK
jgi:hypothetical protein